MRGDRYQRNIQPKNSKINCQRHVKEIKKIKGKPTVLKNNNENRD